MRAILSSIEGEWRRYQVLGEGALRQTRNDELTADGPGGGNSIAIIIRHIAGNLKSRFTDFLTSDGEKSWRRRDSEFEQRDMSREDLMRTWNEGWNILFAALAPLTDDDLSRTVIIRGERFLVQKRCYACLRTRAITWDRSSTWRSHFVEVSGIT